MPFLQTLAPQDAEEVTAVLCDSFVDYPVMRHVLRESGRAYSAHLEEACNVPLHEHFGYEVVGHARISTEFETWSMFRGDPS